MAATNTPTTLVSRLREVYPEGITEIIPNSTILIDQLKFKSELAPGEKARFDVQTDHENGFTVGQGEITLNSPVAQSSEKAEVEGYSIILRSRVSYDLITRAKTNKQAFARFNDSKFIPMVESFQKRQELLALGCGRQGLGVVTNNSSGTLTISNKTWCAARWLGMKNVILEAFTAVTGGSQHDGDLTISSISVANKTVTVTGTSTAVVNGDILFFKGHRSNSPYGLLDIAKNTGTLYNIDASSVQMWGGQSYNVGTSGLTLGKILEAAGYAADFGCDEMLMCLVPSKCFQSLVNDQAALRDHGADYDKGNGENGFEKLTFYGATGKIMVVPYMFMAEGEFLLFPPRFTYRIGSSDVTNQLAKDGDMIFDLESTSAKEMRLFAEWTVFSERPAWFVYGTRSDGNALHAA